MRRVIGLDPGLRKTGWGVIEQDGNRLRHIAHGSIRTDADQSTAERLRTLHDGLAQVLADHDGVDGLWYVGPKEIGRAHV